jgi:hypothetical protein
MTSELEDIYEIILSDGRKLRLTNNHKIKILSRERFRNKETNWKFFKLYEQYKNVAMKYSKEFNIPKWIPKIYEKNMQEKKCGRIYS